MYHVQFNRLALSLMVFDAILHKTTSFSIPSTAQHNQISSTPLSLRFQSSLLIPTSSSNLKPLQATKEATFGCGCFWKPAEEILKEDGIISTVAGYTGKNANKAPNYESVCASSDWVEGVRVTYDDSKLSYEDVLDLFYKCQEPSLGSRQYGSFIFAHDETQESVAKQWIDSGAISKEDTINENMSGTIMRSDGFKKEWTKIEPLQSFYQAEGYHQRYWEKQRPRFAAIFVLLIGSSGFLDFMISPLEQLIPAFQFRSICNACAIAIAVFQLLERKLDNKVIEL